MAQNVDACVEWCADFADRAPMYEPLRLLARHFSSFAQWPQPGDYQQVLEALPHPILTRNGKALKIVRQEGRPQGFEQHYAPRIYLTGEMQTRERNWHDFFQFLSWLLFPETKAIINATHIPGARERLQQGGDPGRRSPLENMLSLFDEGGAVVVSSDESLLQLIRDFQWRQLFRERREELGEKLQCIVFGHALYEKGLMPYIGMTANTMLLQVEEGFLQLPMTRRLQLLDQRLARILAHGRCYVRPRDLAPFPLLGMPGWDPDNECETYYDNVRYFRPGRRKHP